MTAFYINALMGYVMKASRGKANPPAVIAMLKKKLDGQGAVSGGKQS
jgi:Asp-tRNA(Asn)/Glu-tRNA(Gln) amidotransferase B subunit